MYQLKYAFWALKRAVSRDGSIQYALQEGHPEVLGIWGEWLLIFRDLEGTGNYFQGFREQAHSFVDLGSPAKK